MTTTETAARVDAEVLADAVLAMDRQTRVDRLEKVLTGYYQEGVADERERCGAVAKHVANRLYDAVAEDLSTDDPDYDRAADEWSAAAVIERRIKRAPMPRGPAAATPTGPSTGSRSRSDTSPATGQRSG